MFPVVLEKQFSQNQNLLKKLNYLEETSSEGKVLLQWSDWKCNGVYYCGISLTVNVSVSVFHVSFLATMLSHLYNFPLFFLSCCHLYACHLSVVFSLCSLCLMSCNLGSPLSPHLSVISFHPSVVLPPVLSQSSQAVLSYMHQGGAKRRLVSSMPLSFPC